MSIQRKDFSPLRLVPYVLVFMFFMGTGFSQLMWQRNYGGVGAEVGYCVEQTTDGGYIVAGFTSSFGNQRQVYLIKTDSLGDTLWTRTYGDTAIECGRYVQQTTDGGYIVVGYTTSFGNGIQIYLIKTDSLGDTVWSRIYGDTADEYGYCVQQTTDGGYIIAGGGYYHPSDDPVYLIKTDSLGDTLWTKTYGAGEGCSVQQTADGGYVVAGYAFPKVYLARTDSFGDTLWTRTYGGTPLHYGYSVWQTTDGGYVVAGYARDQFEFTQFYLVKTDSLGDTLWTKTYGGEGHHSEGYSVQQTNDGGYIITGVTDAFGNGFQVYTVKSDSFGDTIWIKHYGGLDYNDEGYSIRQTQDGGYIITGYTTSFGNGYQVYLIKTDADGNVGLEENDFDRHLSHTVQLTAYPNPFRNRVEIRCRMPDTRDQIKNKPIADITYLTSVSLKIYDATGRLVKSFNHLTNNQSSVLWSGDDDSGHRVPPGVYFCRLESDKITMTTKIIKLK